MECVAILLQLCDFMWEFFSASSCSLFVTWILFLSHMMNLMDGWTVWNEWNAVDLGTVFSHLNMIDVELLSVMVSVSADVIVSELLVSFEEFSFVQGRLSIENDLVSFFKFMMLSVWDSIMVVKILFSVGEAFTSFN